MKIYRNPFVNHPYYFVKTGAGWTGRTESSKSKGYCVERRDGKWICRNVYFCDCTIKNELILVAENRESIHKVIENAVIDTVLRLVKENLRLEDVTRCPYCNYIPKCNEQTCKDCKVYEDFLDDADKPLLRFGGK